ncbi:MAG: NAD(P)-dependent alcohol dehydrogenase [Sphingobacteriales bacterium]|nr:MAG: NAD(P)-dependent alcohol dehydrogenase [Sphingobacteriales bacterium]
MKAVVYRKYGAPDVLELTETDMPEVGDHDVLIRIKATAVNSGDCRLRKADPFLVRLLFGLFKPRLPVLGVVFAGDVVKTGNSVTLFKEGDKLFGLSDTKMGTYAEYISLPESAVMAKMPGNVNYEEAASIPFGGHTALYFLKKANIQSGQKVLIYGASGAVGSAAVQIAKYFGASVTGVCSTGNIDLVKSLGADKVLDYTNKDVAYLGFMFDIIFETVNKVSVTKISKLVKKDEVLILGSAMFIEALQGFWVSLTQGKKVIMGEAKATAEDMVFLKKLVEGGFLKPVIDRKFRLDQITLAHTYVDLGHKKGNVTIEMPG